MSLLNFIPVVVREAFLCRRLLLIYAFAWTFFLTLIVAVTSFAPEFAFVWAVQPSSSFSRPCTGIGNVASLRILMEGPAGDVVCLPCQFFRRSMMDVLVPPLFAALVVGASACLVRAVGLWESEEDAID